MGKNKTKQKLDLLSVAQSGGKISKRLGGIIGCKDEAFFMVVTLGQQYNVGEKPTVILYTYINRHAGTPNKLLLISYRRLHGGQFRRWSAEKY